MQQGKVVKKILIIKQGHVLKKLFGKVGIVQTLDKKNVEIMIEGRIYKLTTDAVELLPNS